MEDSGKGCLDDGRMDGWMDGRMDEVLTGSDGNLERGRVREEALTCRGTWGGKSAQDGLETAAMGPVGTAGPG